MKTAVVICPGRGTYNATELGYLSRHFPDAALLSRFDATRQVIGQEQLSVLDSAARFTMSTHARGDNAAGLIYAATYGDYLSIDGEKVRVVAVTGNSMGWYSALACGGAVTPENGFRIANTMGTLMQEAMIGGQIIYPWLGEEWRPDFARKTELLGIVAAINARADHILALSIDLGGMLVLAGNEAGLKAFEASVSPLQGRFPMRLGGHAAFHTALQEPVAEKGRAALGQDLFGQPQVPLIDGRGAIWWPGATDPAALRAYTLGHQVVEPYDFTRALAVAAREFAPDLFIITGPGTTLGGAVAQSLILNDWRGMADKASFQALQGERGLLVSMGMAEQRVAVSK
ncbi:ACP S-malonyltransferase [Xinfangfangia sp. CPCC 101601]|uniref:[acyl-carrier-protein] S-malonyltransferase n=1 Tax=Pseudogemmobacter lacusdianii TaxID=3069608 RepID=A0ABU0VYU1_9RHOB|nr:ACP S-malonyltransferase [Xinfangfangia sp. CPCC 101601]MDQ2066060.1 ACP S-malonyltransferase [Xinfangfangia sp. CPCC 101601]